METPHPNQTIKNKLVTIIADDYGISSGVSEAILELYKSGRISGFSCLVNFPEWPREAKKIDDAHLNKPQEALIGLHLNLTAGPPTTHFPITDKYKNFPGLKRILLYSLLGWLPYEAVKTEIAMQIEKFVEERKCLPNMIDGHQHVHILPTVRSALLDVLKEIDPKRKILVRDTSDKISSIFARGEAINKALLLNLLSKGFREKFASEGFRLNKGFSGYSTFEHLEDYRDVFIRSLLSLGEDPMIMVHPGHAHDSELLGRDDAIDTRPLELGYLKSVRYLEDLALSGLNVRSI